ncbi:winged-helix domain-containing protein [Elusimicrobiota bacterium]
MVTESGELAARWERILSRMGVRCARVSSMRALERDALAGPDKDAPAVNGLALVDWDLLGATPKTALEALRKQVRGVHLIVFGDGESLCVPGIERVMEAGILDVFPMSWEDGMLADKLRVHVGRLCPRTSASGVLESGGLRMDLRSREVRVRGGRSGWRESAALSPKAFDLLRLLLENAGQPLVRQALMERVWGERSGEVNPEALDKQMGALRKRLGPQGKRIRTIRGVGYYLADEQLKGKK